jgi:hypothetical protein
MIAYKPVLAILILFMALSFVRADNSVFKHNLSFAMNRKEAKKTLENAGYEILDEIKISKKFRTFSVQSFLYNNISQSGEMDVNTEFEFYDNKLMSSTLLFKTKDYLSNIGLTNKYRSELTENFGKPSAYEKVMSIQSWMWLEGNKKILLNFDGRKKTVQISYIYLPLYTKKYEDEVEVQLKGEPFDPAKHTFMR